MLEIIVRIVVWFFVAWYAMKIIVGMIYAFQNKYPRQIIREVRDDIFAALLHSLLLISLLLYSLKVI